MYIVESYTNLVCPFDNNCRRCLSNEFSRNLRDSSTLSARRSPLLSLFNVLLCLLRRLDPHPCPRDARWNLMRPVFDCFRILVLTTLLLVRVLLSTGKQMNATMCLQQAAYRVSLCVDLVQRDSARWRHCLMYARREYSNIIIRIRIVIVICSDVLLCIWICSTQWGFVWIQ